MTGDERYHRYSVESSQRMVGGDDYAAVGGQVLFSAYLQRHTEFGEHAVAEVGVALGKVDFQEIVEFVLADKPFKIPQGKTRH